MAKTKKLPEEFLVIAEYGAHFQYRKRGPNDWDKLVVDQYGDYTYDDNVDDKYIRQVIKTAKEIWVKYQK